jgi:hypothetical protein
MGKAAFNGRLFHGLFELGMTHREPMHLKKAALRLP